MALDRDRIRFKGKVISACMRKNASLEEEGTDSFFDELYADIQAAGIAVDACEEWLDEKLASTFLSMKEPPKWVEEEPSWPFLDGKPMVFISQSTLDDGTVSNSMLSPGETVYLFGARRPVGTGFEMVYRTVSQFEGLQFANKK